MSRHVAKLLPPPELTVLTGASGWFGRGYLNAVALGDSEETGPVGRDGVIRVLVPRPEDVTAVQEVAPKAEIHVGDIADPAVVDRLFHGCRDASVVHAAGVIHPARYADFERVNVVGTTNVLVAAAREGVRRVVHISSNSPFGTNPRTDDLFRQHEPFNPYLGYGESKMRGEAAASEAHRTGRVETVIVRPPWFYGPWQPLRQTTFFTLVRKGRLPVIGDGRNRRSMVYVENLVQGVALAERHPTAPGQAFWVADSEPYEMRAVVETVKRALRDEGLDVTDRQFRLPALAGRVAERIDRTLQARGIYHQEMHVLGEMDKTIACDISATESVLGYAPQIGLLEGMRRSIRWCRQQGVAL
jgi:nucleoside-diphosphate-sugar epimerase